MPLTLTEAEIQAVYDTFKQLVRIDRRTGCWEWAGAYRQSRPIMSVKDREMPVVVVAWLLFKGPLPSDKTPLRTCGTPNCVQPGHQRLANSYKRPERKTDPRQKLDWEMVREIRRRYAEADGQHGIGKTLAREYGVSNGTISLIVHNKLWIEPEA